MPTGYTRARATCHTIWSNNTGGNRFVQIDKNGSTALSACMSVGQNEAGSMCSTGWTTVAAGDTLSVQVLQSSGGAINFSPAAGFGQAFFEVEWAP